MATLEKYDADEPYYIGYAFLAAAHLEGIIEGVRRPVFINGGAGIALSRGAIRLVMPILRKCEAEYAWDWPGDTRVAQCLADVGVGAEWVRNFHSENHRVIIEKADPGPRNVPVNLHLPPVSFHHVDAGMIAELELMQARFAEKCAEMCAKVRARDVSRDARFDRTLSDGPRRRVARVRLRRARVPAR